VFWEYFGIVFEFFCRYFGFVFEFFCRYFGTFWDMCWLGQLCWLRWLG
jgi:hypothetical protein